MIRTIYRARTGFEKFWKVMEIENAVFEELESFGKERSFQNGYGKFWIFVWKSSKIS